MKLGTTVTLTYRGTLEDGSMFGYADAEKPMVFQTGMDQAIDGFEKEILTMSKIGEKKTFTVDPYEAYGEYLDDYTTQIPRDQIPVDNIAVEKRIWLASSEDGTPLPATCIALDNETATFDLNHPLAGKNLIFQVEIIDLQEAPNDFVSAAEKARRMKEQSKLLGGDQASDYR